MSVARPNPTAMMKLSSAPPQSTPLGGAPLPLRRGFRSRGALSLSLNNNNNNNPSITYVSSSSRSKKKKSWWVGASQVSSSGSIDSPLMQSMHDKIKEQLNADTVVVKDAYGDGRHVRSPNCFHFLNLMDTPTPNSANECPPLWLDWLDTCIS